MFVFLFACAALRLSSAYTSSGCHVRDILGANVCATDKIQQIDERVGEKVLYSLGRSLAGAVPLGGSFISAYWDALDDYAGPFATAEGAFNEMAKLVNDQIDALRACLDRRIEENNGKTLLTDMKAAIRTVHLASGFSGSEYEKHVFDAWTELNQVHQTFMTRSWTALEYEEVIPKYTVFMDIYVAVLCEQLNIKLGSFKNLQAISSRSSAQETLMQQDVSNFNTYLSKGLTVMREMKRDFAEAAIQSIKTDLTPTAYSSCGRDSYGSGNCKTTFSNQYNTVGCCTCTLGCRHTCKSQSRKCYFKLPRGHTCTISETVYGGNSCPDQWAQSWCEQRVRDAANNIKGQITSHVVNVWRGRLVAPATKLIEGVEEISQLVYNRPAAVENSGNPCWANCGNKGGNCAYCGSGGACCRKGYSPAGQGCSATSGCTGQHCCVRSNSVAPWQAGGVLHEGENCWNSCGQRAGSCPGYCGSGSCCKKNDFTGTCNGADGCTSFHCCTNTGSVSGLTLRNEGTNCWNGCLAQNGACPAFCGSGYCCKKGVTGGGCTGQIGCNSNHCCTAAPASTTTSTSSGLENPGQNCWDGCGAQSGRCSSFCGTGMCCKKGDSSNGCNGQIGCTSNHCCVATPTSVGVLSNAGENCWNGCGQKAGFCPVYCGTGGSCCKAGESTTNAPGCGQWNGCLGEHCCVANQGGVVKTSKRVDNPGVNCWNSCGSKGGACPSFCGADGACCRRNQGETGCNNGAGCTDKHCCVEANYALPVSALLEGLNTMWLDEIISMFA